MDPVATRAEEVLSLRPDLVVVDAGDLRPDLLTSIRTFCSVDPSVPVVVVADRSDEAERAYWLRYGVDEFITLPCGTSELAARLYAALRRSKRKGDTGCHRAEAEPADPLPAHHIQFGDVVVDVLAHRVTRSGREILLTPREFDLLLALVRRPRVLRRKSVLLADVWHGAMNVSSRVLDQYLCTLRHKVEVEPSRPRHFITVHGHGIRFEP